MKTHLYSAFYSYFTECLIYNSCNNLKTRCARYKLTFCDLVQFSYKWSPGGWKFRAWSIKVCS